MLKIPFDKKKVLAVIQRAWTELPMVESDEYGDSQDPDWDSLQTLSRWLKPLGFKKHYAHGCFRATFFYKSEPIVLKVPIHPMFAIASMEELKRTKSAPKKYKSYFPETVHLGKGILVQPLYEVAIDSDGDSFFEKQEEIETIANRLHITDMHSENWGFDSKGNPVFLDFSSRTVLELLWEIYALAGQEVSLKKVTQTKADLEKLRGELNKRIAKLKLKVA